MITKCEREKAQWHISPAQKLSQQVKWKSYRKKYLNTRIFLPFVPVFLSQLENVSLFHTLPCQNHLLRVCASDIKQVRSGKIGRQTVSCPLSQMVETVLVFSVLKLSDWAHPVNSSNWSRCVLSSQAFVSLQQFKARLSTVLPGCSLITMTVPDAPAVHDSNSTHAALYAPSRDERKHVHQCDSAFMSLKPHFWRNCEGKEQHVKFIACWK